MKKRTFNVIQKNATLIFVVAITYFILFVLSIIFKLVALRAIAAPQIFFMLLSWIVVSIVLLVWAKLSKEEAEKESEEE